MWFGELQPGFISRAMLILEMCAWEISWISFTHSWSHGLMDGPTSSYYSQGLLISPCYSTVDSTEPCYGVMVVILYVFKSCSGICYCIQYHGLLNITFFYLDWTLWQYSMYILMYILKKIVEWKRRFTLSTPKEPTALRPKTEKSLSLQPFWFSYRNHLQVG